MSVLYRWWATNDLYSAITTIERSLPVKGYKWPILRNHDYWAFFTGEGLQMTHTPQSRLLSVLYRWRATNDPYSAIRTSERSLSCYTYLDTQHPLKLVISEDSWFTYLLVAKQLTVKLSLPVYNDLRLSRLGFEHPTFRLRAERSNRLRLVIKWNLNREFSKSTALSIA